MPTVRHAQRPPDHPPSDAPVLSVRDTQILDLLRSGAPIRRAIDVGIHRGSWTRDDVLRVAAHMRPEEPQPKPPPKRRRPRTEPSVFTEWQPPVPDGDPAFVVLTAPQADLLTALCCGESTDALCDRYGIGVETLRTRLRVLFRALGVGNRQQAVAVALTGCVRVLVRPDLGRAS